MGDAKIIAAYKTMTNDQKEAVREMMTKFFELTAEWLRDEADEVELGLIESLRLLED